MSLPYPLFAVGLCSTGIAVWTSEPLLQGAGAITAAIAFFTHFYADKQKSLYAALYALALGGVALFVYAETVLWTFAGWELVSIAAWGLLVSSRGWTNRSLQAAFIAFVTNRVGDVCWLVAAFAPGQLPLGFLVAGMIKSGAFPFTFWLVQAMYAPATVSALLHSALLVALGAYLPLKAAVLPSIADLSPLLLRRVGEITAAASAIGALLSRSSKVALAWTTAAHLSLSIAHWGEPQALADRLLHHSYLKAALFLLLGLHAKGLLGGRIGQVLWFIGSIGLVGFSHSLTWEEIGIETLLGITLGRIGGSFSKVTKGNIPPLLSLLSIAFLQGMGLLSAEGPATLPAVGWPLLGWIGGRLATHRLLLPARLDWISLLIARRTYQGWIAFSKLLALGERRFVQALDTIALSAGEIGWKAEKTESYLATVGWQKLGGKFRQAMARLATFEPMLSYQGALRWALLITLMSGMLWRFLR